MALSVCLCVCVRAWKLQLEQALRYFHRVVVVGEVSVLHNQLCYLSEGAILGTFFSHPLKPSSFQKVGGRIAFWDKKGVLHRQWHPPPKCPEMIRHSVGEKWQLLAVDLLREVLPCSIGGRKEEKKEDPLFNEMYAPWNFRIILTLVSGRPEFHNTPHCIWTETTHYF